MSKIHIVHITYLKKKGEEMTAQIGILNKHGIALATDSAVTITGNDNQKVYNTANKLFSLSNSNPVGIMIYGSAQFMSVPWETIIKCYREDLKDKSYDTLEEYYQDFLKYLQNNEVLLSYYAFDTTLHRTLSLYLTVILNKVNVTLKSVKEDEKNENTIASVISNEMGLFLDNTIPKMKFNSGFDDSFINENLINLDSLLEKVINENIYVPLTEDTKCNIKKVLVSLLAKDFYTNQSSGIVISGYGNKEIFPSLYEFKFEGIFKGKIKYKIESSTVIGSEVTDYTTTASIKAFAQKDMVQTFINGIDPNFRLQLFDSLYQILLESYPEIISKNLGITLDEVSEQRLGMISNEIYNHMLKEVAKYQDDNFRYPIIDTVQLMPKEELATVAETLLNLASLKKRVTMDTESVGGPIDVAIISKNDGLIWIKRKHYFNADLNYRFFKNNGRYEK